MNCSIYVSTPGPGAAANKGKGKSTAYVSPGAAANKGKGKSSASKFAFAPSTDGKNMNNVSTISLSPQPESEELFRIKQRNALILSKMTWEHRLLTTYNWIKTSTERKAALAEAGAGIGTEHQRDEHHVASAKLDTSSVLDPQNILEHSAFKTDEKQHSVLSPPAATPGDISGLGDHDLEEPMGGFSNRSSPSEGHHGGRAKSSFPTHGAQKTTLFHELCNPEQVNDTTAALTFADILALASAGELALRQECAYGPIEIAVPRAVLA